MFDFQKLLVYQKAKDYNKRITFFIKDRSFDAITRDQLRRASFSIMLNIAEGSSRFSNRDRRNFLVISRGSVFECVAVLEYLLEVNEIEQTDYDLFAGILEELSRMLYALIKKLD